MKIFLVNQKNVLKLKEKQMSRYCLSVRLPINKKNMIAMIIAVLSIIIYLVMMLTLE